jgi:hypothetical protein
MMANKVRKSIIEELTEAGYFSLSVDSTPDNSHIDQLTIVVRYVSPTDGKPVERFLNFIPIESHTGEDLANVVMKYLCTDCEIDFGKWDSHTIMLRICRGVTTECSRKSLSETGMLFTFRARVIR